MLCLYYRRIPTYTIFVCHVGGTVMPASMFIYLFLAYLLHYVQFSKVVQPDTNAGLVICERCILSVACVLLNSRLKFLLLIL